MGKHIIVGGTKGIGKQVARDLKKKGEEVLIICRGKEADKTWDVEGEEAFPKIEEAVDSLVYCPGTINLKPFTQLREKDFLHDFKVNLLGAVNAIQGALGALKKGQAPSIVMFSTVAVQMGMPYHASIAAAKGSVEGLIRSLAAELAPKIRVNGIAPSLTETSLSEMLLNSDHKKELAEKRHPLGKVGTPEDISKGVLYLLEDKWVTGQILHIDGGLSKLRLL